MENPLNQVKLIIFYSLINGENYNGLLDTLNAMGYELSDHESAVLIKTIKFYLQFRIHHREPASFNLHLKILLDMFNMINQSISISYIAVNHTIYNNSFRPYLNYNYNQLSQLLNADSFILTNRPDWQVRAPFPLNQIYLTALDNYLVNFEDNESDSDEEMVPVQPIQVNPNQIIILNNPDLIPPTEASLTGPCVVCQLHDTGQGWCRVDCGGGHVGHCSCFTRWRNTHTTTIDFETNDELENVAFHNECPICRGIITNMVHIPQPPNVVAFGKRKKENKTLNLISLEKDIKYLNKLK